MAPDLSRLRRRTSGARYSQRQLNDALAGKIKEGNTRKGSTARSAVRRAQYVGRIERAEERGLSRRQARGHPGRGERLISEALVEWSEVPTTEGIVDLTTTTNREATRVGRYLRDVRALLEDEIDPRDFRRRWTRWVRAAGGHELEADPDRVLAMVFIGGPGPVDRYRRLEPGAPS